MPHEALIELHKSYLRVFSTPDGRRVLQDLQSRGHAFASTFSTEPGRTQFNEGRRTMVLHVEHMLNSENFNQTTEETRNG